MLLQLTMGAVNEQDRKATLVPPYLYKATIYMSLQIDMASINSHCDCHC